MSAPLNEPSGRPGQLPPMARFASMYIGLCALAGVAAFAISRPSK